MTVKELIEQLSTLPQDAMVWQAIDPEGNGFRPCGDVATSVMRTEDAENARFTEEAFVPREELDGLRDRGFTEEDCLGYGEDDDEFSDKGVKVVIIWPN